MSIISFEHLVLADEQDKKDFNDLTKILVIIAIKRQGGLVKDLKASIVTSLYPNVIKFFKKYKIPTENFAALVANMLKKSDEMADFVPPFLDDLKNFMRSSNTRADLDILSTTTKEVLNPTIILLNNPNSKNALTTLVNKVSSLKEKSITDKLNKRYREIQQDRVEETNDELNIQNRDRAPLLSTVTEQLKEVCKRLTGRKDIVSISAAEKLEYKNDPAKVPLLARYAILKKQFTEIKSNELKLAIDSLDKNVVSVKQLILSLKKRGVTDINIPQAFIESNTIYINQDAKYCDKDARVLSKQAPQPGGEVKVNPNYSHDNDRNNWVYSVTTELTTNYVYTVDKIQNKKDTRFTKSTDIAKNRLGGIKDSWRSDMNNEDLDNERSVYAFLAEYIFWTASRVGAGEGSTDNSRTYGASNFLVKHIINLPKSFKSVPSRLEIRYPIKSGATDSFILSSDLGNLPDASDVPYMKKLIKFIVTKCENKSPEDHVWTINKKRLDTGKFNSYLNSIESGMTAKYFRTIRGTQLAITALDQAKDAILKLEKTSKKSIPDKTVNEAFTQAMTAVGELLGHVRRNTDGEHSTATTAISSYVDPNIMLQWYKELKRQPNSKVISACRAAGIQV